MHLAREFGFCYGVDRAVDYAYQTRERFPDRRVFLTGEIIHNPHVNDKLRAMGIRFLSDAPAKRSIALAADDVVILPAFGVTVAMLAAARRRGCTLVDTTCGSVLNVWKNVRRYAEGGYTSIIHGKVWHEETQATASQAVAVRRPVSGRLRPRRNRRWSATTSAAAATARRSSHGSRSAASPGFDPDRDLQRIGLANQTTMLMSESLEIGEMLKARDAAIATARRTLAEHFQAFDTICSATQDRQDAVVALLASATGRSDDRDRRLQQQQHREPGAHLRRVAADLPHRRP